MNYGLYLSASGALASMHRQDVLANNLANMETVAYKPSQVDMRERLPERLEDTDVFADPHLLLERLGGGLFVAPSRIDLGQGGMTATGNDLDLAIEGDGMFVVRVGEGDAGLRLTRDGRFTMNSRGTLVTRNGHEVVGAGRRPIRLDSDQPVQVTRDGAIEQNGAVVGRLQVVPIADQSMVIKEGSNLMRLADGVAMPRDAADGLVRQHHVEASTVDPIKTMMGMMAAAKAAQANLKMMQYHDQVLGQAFNTFGRVA
jgi:flagellar basal-body rod protein FlgF